MMQVRHNKQPYESDWLIWHDESPIARQIEQFIMDKYWVYDADVCGTHTHEFVVRHMGETTCWRADHDWWIETDPEWSCENLIHVTQVDAVTFTHPDKNRLWLKLTERK